MRDNGLLSEQDRAQFEQENLSLTPGGREQAYIQKFYLYLNLTKPEEELHLFYSRSGADGKAKRPAYLIGEIRRLFPDAPVIDEASKPLTEQELTPEIGLQELIRGLRMQSDAGGSSWMELYNWYKKHPEWAEKIGDLLDASFYLIIRNRSARKLQSSFTVRISRTAFPEWRNSLPAHLHISWRTDCV